jgi:hypothetical protein
VFADIGLSERDTAHLHRLLAKLRE